MTCKIIQSWYNGQKRKDVGSMIGVTYIFGILVIISGIFSSFIGTTGGFFSNLIIGVAFIAFARLLQYAEDILEQLKAIRERRN